MNELNHKQAQQWLNARLAGALSPDEGQALDAHLQSCPACQRYARQIEKLDAGLRRHFHNSAVDRPPARAAYAVTDQVRANMFARRVLKFAGSAALLLGLIALVGVLASLTRQSITPAAVLPAAPTAAQPLPGSTPTPTAPAPPTATPGPLDDAGQIAAILEGLANQNAQFLHQQGWVRTQISDAATRDTAAKNAEAEGTQVVFYTENWQHYPQADGICTEGFTLSGLSPESMQVDEVWAGGLYASRQEVRDKRGRVKAVTPADVNCVVKAEITSAGDLAARLRGKPSINKPKDAGNNLETVQAWYESQAGRPVFIIEAKFSSEQAKPPVQIEQYTFDLENGLLLGQKMNVQYADGAPFTEWQNRWQIDFFTELPAETVPVFQRALAEMKAYATDPASAPLPAPTAPAGVLEIFPTSPEAATSNVDLIVSALRTLRERQVQRLSQPGWYVYEDPVPVTGDGFNDLPRMLIHSTGEGRCELMTFYRTGAQVLPQEIRLADGRWGLIGTVMEGNFTEGSAQDTPCSLDGLETVQQLDRLISALPEQTPAQTTQYRAWIGTTDASADRQEAGRAVLVLVADTTYSDPKPGGMDPDTKKLEPVDRMIERNVFDLGTGMPLAMDRQTFLSNGQVVGEQPEGSALLPGGAPLYRLTFSPDPPAGLATVFTQAVERLQKFLNK